MILLGGKKIVGGYLGSIKAKALYLGRIKVFPDEVTPPPIEGEITLNPTEAMFPSLGGEALITLFSKTAWNMQVTQ